MHEYRAEAYVLCTKDWISRRSNNWHLFWLETEELRVVKGPKKFHILMNIWQNRVCCVHVLRYAHRRNGLSFVRRGGGGGGAEVSYPIFFSPLLARKSSGFARITLDCLLENCYLKNSWGCSPPPPPRPMVVRLCAWLSNSLLYRVFRNIYFKMY